MCVRVCVCVFVCARVCVCLFRLEAWRGQYCSRKADPFRGPKLGSCLTLGSELSEETHVLTEEEILLLASNCAKATGGKLGSAMVLYEEDMANIYRLAKE